MEVIIMVVQHNLTAMNSNRMLGVTTSAQAKSTEKYHQVIRLTEQPMMQQDFQFPRR